MSNIYIMPVIGGIMLFIFHVCLSSIKVLYSINMTSLNWICLCHSCNVATVKVFFAGHLQRIYTELFLLQKLSRFWRTLYDIYDFKYSLERAA